MRNQIVTQPTDSNMLGITNEEFHQNKDRAFELNDRVNISQRLINTTLESLERMPDAFGLVVFGRLSAVLHREEIYKGWEGQIFGQLIYELENRYGHINQFKTNLIYTAIEYFKIVFMSEFQISTYEQLENDKLPEIRQKVKDKIKTYNFHGIRAFDRDSAGFEYLALRDIYIGLRKEFNKRQTISRQKKEIECRETTEALTRMISACHAPPFFSQTNETSSAAVPSHLRDETARKIVASFAVIWSSPTSRESPCAIVFVATSPAKPSALVMLITRRKK